MRLASVLSAACAAFFLAIVGSEATGAASPGGSGPRPVPALLASRLRVADQACLDALARLPGVTPDLSSRWARAELDRVKANLLLARDSTVDPAERLRLERLAADAQDIGSNLRVRPADSPLRLIRLRSEIRLFSAEVQRRIELARREPVQPTRPPLVWPSRGGRPPASI